MVYSLELLTKQEFHDKLFGQKLDFILIKDGIEYIWKAVMTGWDE